MTPPPFGYSVVVPAYNSADSLPDLATRLELVLRSLGASFELIIVNDGSRDGTWSTVKELASRYPWVRGMCCMRNYGQHNALLAGIRAAQYSLVITMDDDLQHPPEHVPRLIEALTDDLDVVYAPPEREQHGFLRDIASVITKLALASAMGAEHARHTSAWRIFRTEIRDAFSECHSSMVSIDVLLTWGTSRFGHVALPHSARPMGASTYTFSKLVSHALNMITGFSTAPLQVASIAGFAFTIFGMATLVYVLINYVLNGRVVAGFAFLASMIAIFSGVQMFSLGMIGEYLARMHYRIMRKPTYVILHDTTLPLTDTTKRQRAGS
jgi:glycosyltransferase involved in cell wall biosynthesis